jgi:hypothetical protein
MKHEFAFDTEIYVCTSDKLVQRDSEIQYYRISLFIINALLFGSQYRRDLISPNVLKSWFKPCIE